MSLAPDSNDLTASGAFTLRPRRPSVRDSYVPAAGLLLAAVASLGLWVGLAEAVRLLVKAIF